MNNKELLRSLPQIDVLLEDDRLKKFPAEYKNVLLKSARSAVDELRKKILIGEITTEDNLSINNIISLIISKIEVKENYALKRVINCTGVVLHTNLGRARLSQRALENVQRVSCGYSNLEYDLKNGVRGSRHDHIESLLKDLVDVESAMVVNNNAAATMLCLSALAKDKESIVSRGELVEIGGSFRIPDIMEQSGSILHEIGTTNKTHIQDYIDAVNEETAILLKVHTSNYRIVGFTAECSIEELSKVSSEYKIPLIHDLGSGLISKLEGSGIDETNIMDSIKAGSDIVLFSGDKMLGGPQCGIIVGKKKFIDKMKKHPLARVVRVDKMTLAALEGTLHDYLFSSKVSESNPTINMITESNDSLKNRASKFKDEIESSTSSYSIEIVESNGKVGGGSAPLVILKGYAVALKSDKLSTSKMERILRKHNIPIIVRVVDDKIIMDMRTIDETEYTIIIDALINMEKGGNDE